jgi:hypothetical protein
MLINFITFALLVSLSLSQYDDPRIIPRTSICRQYTEEFESFQQFIKGNMFTIPSGPGPITFNDTEKNDVFTLDQTRVRSGNYSAKHSILGPNDSVHGIYPTLMFQNTVGKAFVTPAYIDFWVYASNVNLLGGQYFVLAQVSPSSDQNDYFQVQIDPIDGFLYLMHTPQYGQKVSLYQNTTLLFPMDQWVKITIFIDYNPNAGIAALWQDDALMAVANITGGYYTINRMHLGIVAPGVVETGDIWNDGLTITNYADDCSTLSQPPRTTFPPPTTLAPSIVPTSQAPTTTVADTIEPSTTLDPIADTPSSSASPTPVPTKSTTTARPVAPTTTFAPTTTAKPKTTTSAPAKTTTKLPTFAPSNSTNVTTTSEPSSQAPTPSRGPSYLGLIPGSSSVTFYSVTLLLTVLCLYI